MVPTFGVAALDGPFVGNLLPDVANEAVVTADHVTPPRMLAEFLPPKREVRVEIERQPTRFMPPVLEERLAGAKQRLTERCGEPIEARKQHDGVTARTGHRDAVELEVAEAGDHRGRGGARPRFAAPRAGGQAGPLGLEQAGAGQREAPRGGDLQDRNGSGRPHSDA